MSIHVLVKFVHRICYSCIIKCCIISANFKNITNVHRIIFLIFVLFQNGAVFLIFVLFQNGAKILIIVNFLNGVVFLILVLFQMVQFFSAIFYNTCIIYKCCIISANFY